MILKSTEFLSETAIAEVKRLHPCQVPCIAKIPVQINEPFGRWIEGECENFTFKPVEEKYLPLLYSWFKKPHVDLWWPVPAEQEDFFKSFLERIRAGIKKPYLVLYNNKPIGYIQSYSIDKSTHSWLPELPQSENMIGIDQFIGEEDYLYKGFGPSFIKNFIDNILTKEGYKTIVVDPDPTNTAAIRCYEKVGFDKIGTYQSPCGPALVMIYNNINPK